MASSHGPWRVSSHSESANSCVEVALREDGSSARAGALVRNSRYPDGAILVFDPEEWEAFLKGVKAGEFG